MTKLCYFFIAWICHSHIDATAVREAFGSISLSDLNEVRRDLDQKISVVNNLVVLIDSNVKSLQEKAHVWDLYRHHIDAWNDQMKSLDHKIDLIKYNQDDSKIIETKLTSMEFLMNHILSKIMLQVDDANDNGTFGSGNRKKQSSTKHFEDVLKMLKDNKMHSREHSNRLNTILRHVLSIENQNCMSVRKNNKSSAKTENVMKPIGRDTDSVLRNIEEKLDEILNEENSKSRYAKELISSESKTAKTLNEIVETSKHIVNISRSLATTQTEHNFKSMNCCTSTLNELSTFTESSDILLKRIERLVLNIQEKVDRVVLSYNDTHLKDTKGEESSKQLTNVVLEENSRSEPAMNSSETAEESESTETVQLDYLQPSKCGCHDLTVRSDGVYKFAQKVDVNDGERDFNERFCAFPTDGAGWTVIQRRGPYDIQENFNRSWTDYKHGFGSLAKDFWFGNDFIHRLTYNGTYELRVELEDFDDTRVWAEYSIFQIDSEQFNYNLIIGGYRGAVSDAMLYHHMQDFSTYDRRNDKSIDECCPCATGYGSGWWYDNCSEANLNGIYHSTPYGHNYIGVVWEHWHGDYSLKRTRMLIRPTAIITGESDENIAKESIDDP